MMSNFFSKLRANPRLRWGLWLMLGILWLYGILVLRDASRVRQEQYQNTIQAISRIHAQSAQQEWMGRAGPSQLLAVELESRLWQASTLGLAQAAFQDWLNLTLAQAAIGRPVVIMVAVDEAGGEAALPADLWKVKAKAEFDFNPQSYIAFMTKAAGNDKQVVFDSVTIRKEPVPRVEIMLAAYFQKPIAAADRQKQ